MKNMKIGTRLGLGFGAILISLAGAIGLGIKDMGDIESRLDDIVNDNNVKVKLVNEMSEAVHIVARVMRTIVLLHDDNAIIVEKKKLDQAREKYDSLYETLKTYPASETGAAIRAKMEASRTEARALNNKVLDLALAHQDKEAVDLLLREAAPATNKWQAVMDENIALQEANTLDSYKVAQAAYDTARNILLGMGALTILFGTAIAYFLTRSVTRPIQQAIQIAEKVAQGDLTQHIAPSSKDETGQMILALKHMNDSLVKLVGDVRTSTHTMGMASGEIAAGNMDLSSRTEQQASSLGETASSMEELTATVKQNADNARQANQLAVSASGVAVKGGDVVRQVVDTMESITESSKKIADIISVIDGIAFQTNILALNAAVEAARAGEQGRGFAVVASEVRNLAQRSAAAAKEIKGLIGDSVEKVESGSKLVHEAGSTMDEIVSSVKRVTDVMAEIMAASQEQSAGIEQVNQAIGQMDQTTQQNAALVEEASAAAHSMQEQAASLMQVVSVFKLDDGQRAAMADPAQTPRAAASGTRSAAAPVRPGKPRAAAAGTAIATAPARRQLPNGTAQSNDQWEEF